MSSQQSAIYVATGEALSAVGDQKGAMLRFQKALAIPNSDRVGVRLAIAHLMAQQDHADDAERQIALALMESEAGETAPPTGDEFVEAADVFRQLHEYQLSETYLGRAKAAGAPDIAVRIGLAQTYLALGDTARASAELAAVNTEDSGSNYQYLLAQAGVYQQEHQGAQALTSFAQAASAAGEDQTARQDLLRAGADAGYQINSKFSMLGNFSLQPTFEDTTVYVLDSKLDQPVPVPPTDIALLPPSAHRWSLNDGRIPFAFWKFHPFQWILPDQECTRSNLRAGTSSIVNRNTTDYSINYGLNPSIPLGRDVITLNGGVQGTIRRDSLSPKQMDQNLFRTFLYVVHDIVL